MNERKRLQKKMLIVDDIEINRMMLCDLFEEEYEVFEAANGQEALDLIAQYGQGLSIVLLDLIMPVLDGLAVLEDMKQSGMLALVPVIVITGEDDEEKTLSSYSFGVSDVIKKPFNPEIVYRRVQNVVDLYAHKNHLEQILEEQRAEIERQARRINQSNLFLIDALSTTVEFRSLESGQHIKHIRCITRLLLEKLGGQYRTSPQEIEAIANASAMHDIGKIAIPDAVLLKPGPLSDQEFEIMKSHPLRGCEILESLTYMKDREYYTYCYEICRHHHERWDGRGYPDKLKGDAISIWAQAASLADVYDALTSERVYKAAYSHSKAVEMILNGECGVFNPALLMRFYNLADTLPDELKNAIEGEKKIFEDA